MEEESPSPANPLISLKFDPFENANAVAATLVVRLPVVRKETAYNPEGRLPASENVILSVDCPTIVFVPP
jgi:hypothetical protein